eukprot:Nitzschia sp. Nitz4//scaffold100_size80364//24944//26332//NITZ4_005339-RA/size80364-processed-gene-0.47-mRNA-1//-1//CDS//3329532079//1397//frame0
MGNVFKKPESPEERQKRLQKIYGVLMPPNFVTGDIRSISSLAAVQTAQCSSPSIVEYLWTTNPGNRLLQEYMQPGVYMNIPTTSGGNVMVDLKSFQAGDPQNSSLEANRVDSNPALTHEDQSTLWAGQSMHPFKFQVLIPTQKKPSLKVAVGGKNLGMTCSVSNDAQGWLEAKYKTQYTSPQLGTAEFLFSSWATLGNMKDTYHMLADPSKKGVSVNSSKPSLNLQAAVDYQESIVALQTQVPISDDILETMKKPIFETLVSINLNHQGGNKVANVDSDAPPPPPPPSLWLTIKQKPYSYWILNLSQILTFDRMVVNLLEERAPRIRQTLGWVVQVEKDTSKAAVGAAAPSTWSAGATFQWNRALASKATLINGHTLKYGLIMKHWDQPRITLSLINSFHFPTAKHSFVGFGLELETSPVSLGTILTKEEAASQVEYSEQTNVPQVPPPPTKLHVRVPSNEK